MHLLGTLLFVIALSVQPQRSALQVYRAECLHAAFDSYVAVLDNCIGYLHCMDEQWFAYQCPPGTHFDEQHQICALDGPQFVCHRPIKMQQEDKEEYVEEGDSWQQSEDSQQEDGNEGEAIEDVENQQEVLEAAAEEQQEVVEEEEEEQQEVVEEEAEEQQEGVEEEGEEQQESAKESEIQPEVNENQTEKELQKPTPEEETQPSLDNSAAEEKDQGVEASQSVVNQTGGEVSTPGTATNETVLNILGAPVAHYTVRPLNCDRSAVTYHAYPFNCGYYYRCWHGYLEVMSCSRAYGWDHKLERCLPLDKARCYGQLK